MWICEKCHSTWTDEEAAKECESRHLKIVSIEELNYPKWAFYKDQRFPEKLKVTVPSDDHSWNYAIYKLEQIGPKGA